MTYKHLVVLSAVAICWLGVILSGAQEQDGPLKKGINKLDQVATQAVQTIESKANEFVKPPAHIPGQSTMPVSAGRGAGRLLRNMTVEGSKFVGTVAKGLLKFTRKTAGALATTARESGSRLIKGRRQSPSAPINIEVQSAPVPAPVQGPPELETSTAAVSSAAPPTAAPETKIEAATEALSSAPATSTQAPAPAELTEKAQEKPANA